jgi:hypothetical protein
MDAEAHVSATQWDLNELYAKDCGKDGVRESILLGEGAVSALAYEEVRVRVRGATAHGWPRDAIKHRWPTKLPLGMLFALRARNRPAQAALRPAWPVVVITTAEEDGFAWAYSDKATSTDELKMHVVEVDGMALERFYETGDLDVLLLDSSTNGHEPPLDSCVCGLKHDGRCSRQVASERPCVVPSGVKIAKTTQPNAALWDLTYLPPIHAATEALFDTAYRSAPAGNRVDAGLAGVKCVNGTALAEELRIGQSPEWLERAFPQLTGAKLHNALKRLIVAWIRKECETAEAELPSNISAAAKLVEALFEHWTRGNRAPTGDFWVGMRCDAVYVDAKDFARNPSFYNQVTNDPFLPAQVVGRGEVYKMCKNPEKCKRCKKCEKVQKGMVWRVQFDLGANETALSVQTSPLSISTFVDHGPLFMV